eukprot:1653597-Prymnesium_polylepis.2
MPAEHHMPGGHSCWPVRRETGASTGMLMWPDVTTDGSMLPEPCERRRRPRASGTLELVCEEPCA